MSGVVPGEELTPTQLLLMRSTALTQPSGGGAKTMLSMNTRGRYQSVPTLPARHSSASVVAGGQDVGRLGAHHGKPGPLPLTYPPKEGSMYSNAPSSADESITSKSVVISVPGAGEYRGTYEYDYEYASSHSSIGSDEEDDESDSDDDVDTLCPCLSGPCMQRFSAVQRLVANIVAHRYFQRFIFLSILINAIMMGLEYHNQPDSLTQAVEISNFVFTGIFALEMCLKIVAFGCFGYISDGFNFFDGIIVMVSFMELFEFAGGPVGGGVQGGPPGRFQGVTTTPAPVERSGGGSLSVLRTFRLLRILKLVRFMPALKRQLVIMLRTIDNVAVFFALLMLFIFIFR